MSSYNFAYDHFVCNKSPNDMKEWVNRFGNNDDRDAYDEYPHLKQNCNYRSRYNILSANEKSFEDTKARYERTWRQSINLSLGICVLLLGIYYQY